VKYFLAEIFSIKVTVTGLYIYPYDLDKIGNAVGLVL
jgi:hypothetical protein